MTTKKIFFPHLDGWRFIAFFSVFLFHSFGSDVPAYETSQVYRTTSWIFQNGNLGVNFFFVLSGFLITFLLINEKELNKRIDVGSFYVRRVLRIWPLYYACVIFGFLFFPYIKTFLGEISTENATPWKYLLFIGNFDIVSQLRLPDFSGIGVLWSVCIEEQFYLLWPLLLAVTPMKFTKYVFVVLILGSFSFRLYNAAFHLKEVQHYFLYTYHTLSVITDMAMGGFAAYLAFHNEKFMNKLENIPRWLIVIVYLAGIMVILFTKEIFYGGWWIAFERIVLSVFFAFTILEQNYAKNSFFKMGNNKLFSYWGKYTYGLYCLHFIGILIALTISSKMGTNQSLFGVMIIETVLALGFSMLLSYLSYNLMEKHFLKLKEKFQYIAHGKSHL